LVAQIYFNKKKDSSLLEMFESPLFDIHMIMRYLYSHGNRPNILEYLVNKLYKEYRNDIKLLDFYLP
jgi:hypothetical protein